MFHILTQNNANLRLEISKLKGILDDSHGTFPEELKPYYEWVISKCDDLYQKVSQNISDLHLRRPDTLPDILSETQSVTWEFCLLNQRWVSPVLRSRPSDHLCLKILRWLHATHPRTASIPVAFSDDEFSILPLKPSLYFMPSSAQQGLLYLPLFFHEYGHLLYSRQKPEMDDLTRDLQKRIADLLEPDIRRNDLHERDEETARAAIVETWYGWMQEVFCDAVGFCIGGRAFLRAFSIYLRMHGRTEFTVQDSELARRSHPVTFLRIRLLSDLARRMGCKSDADALEIEWEQIARTMGIIEDYFGYFEESFLPDLQQTVDCMLTETAPRMFTEDEESPVRLLNEAWDRFDDDYESYGDWETKVIERFFRDGQSWYKSPK